MKKGLIIACLIAILSSCVGQGKTEEYEDARYKIDSSDSLVNRLKFAVIEDGDTIAYKKLEKIYSEQKDFNFYVYSRVMVDRYNYMPACVNVYRSLMDRDTLSEELQLIALEYLRRTIENGDTAAMSELQRKKKSNK